MAGKKISTLTASSAQVGDVVPVTRGTTNYKVDVATVAALSGAQLAANAFGVYVNDFYPPGVTAHDGGSHPLSGFYATLADAQVFYPHATSLTDEFDWCAWQAACNYVRTRIDYGYQNLNWGTGRIFADGRYMVNKAIQFSLCSIIVQGVNDGERYRYGGATCLKYNGPGGTDTAKVAIFDYYPYDENGVAPPGLLPIHGQGVFKCYDIGFFGSGTGALANIQAAPSTTGYVSGIRLRAGSMCEITRCNFGDGLYDAIQAASQMFLRVHHNLFYGVHRDCISILGQTVDFSTTVWIDDNEFGFFGRYAILLNFNGSVEPSPSVRRNSFEGQEGTSYYCTHPEWFVQGLVADVCQIGGTYGQYSENRFEGGHDLVTANFHFIATGFLRILNNRIGGLAFSSYRNNPNRTTADYPAFASTYKYVDITDTRNFHAPLSTDFLPSSVNSDIVLDLYQGYVVNVSGTGISGGSAHSFSNCQIFPITIPVDTSGYYYKVYPTLTSVPRSSTVVIPATMSNVLYSNHPSHGPMLLESFSTQYNSGMCHVYAAPGFGTWAAGTAYKAKAHASVRASELNKKWIVPTVYNGYVYECIVAGTSGGSEPTWPTTIGNTVVDGGVTWACAFPIHLSASSVGESMLNGQRICTGNAAPTTGRWSVGDKVLNRVPAASGFEGWVCVAAGIPGTWKTFGAISS